MEKLFEFIKFFFMILLMAALLMFVWKAFEPEIQKKKQLDSLQIERTKLEIEILKRK